MAKPLLTHTVVNCGTGESEVITMTREESDAFYANEEATEVTAVQEKADKKAAKDKLKSDLDGATTVAALRAAVTAILYPS